MITKLEPVNKQTVDVDALRANTAIDVNNPNSANNINVANNVNGANSPKAFSDLQNDMNARDLAMQFQASMGSMGANSFKMPEDEEDEEDDE